MAGCTGFKTDYQVTTAGQLILNQDRIKTIDVVKGAAEQTRVNFSDSDKIFALINKVKEIPLNELSKREDDGFMPERIRDESVLILSLYSDDTSKSLEGQFFIWPDGYIYAVDVSSMKGNQRTISYLSKSKYPEIYKWLMDTYSFSHYAQSDQVLTLTFDSAGNYTGFSDLPPGYTAEQAKEDGCYVKVESETVSGQEKWDAFVAQSGRGKDTSIRIVSLYKNSICYYDLFHADGYYRVFNSQSSDLQDHPFLYLRKLEGRLPNAAKDGSVTILTDDQSLTYEDVMWTFLSSDSNYRKTISPFNLLFLK